MSHNEDVCRLGGFVTALPHLGALELGADIVNEAVESAGDIVWAPVRL